MGTWDLVQWLLNGVITFMLWLGKTWIDKVSDNHAELVRNINEIRKDYALKEDVKDMKNEILESIRRLDDKIEKLK